MDGAMRRVRENVVVTTATMRLTADAVDWNTETGQIEARGNVHFENLQDGQKMSCQLAQYDVNADTGKFFNVSGSAPAKVEFKPGLLQPGWHHAAALQHEFAFGAHKEAPQF